MTKIALIAALSILMLPMDVHAQSFDTDRSLSGEEYSNIPRGLLLDKTAQMKEQAQAAIKQDAAGQNDDGQPRHINYDTAQKLYRQGKFAEALAGVTPLANSGNTAALELLGVMTRLGQGVDKDAAKAFVYLSKAANENRPLAQHHLGVMYYTGEGVEADPVQALSWLQVAILHYPDGPEKTRANQDRDAIYKQLNRRDRDAAMKIARDFLETKGEAHLLDLQQ